MASLRDVLLRKLALKVEHGGLQASPKSVDQIVDRVDRFSNEMPYASRIVDPNELAKGFIDSQYGGGGYMAIMPPSSFLNLASPMNMDPYDFQKFKRLEGLIREGTPFDDLPYLEYDNPAYHGLDNPNSVMIGSHEGRHRSFALSNIGSNVPVRMYDMTVPDVGDLKPDTNVMAQYSPHPTVGSVNDLMKLFSIGGLGVTAGGLVDGSQTPEE